MEAFEQGRIELGGCERGRAGRIGGLKGLVSHIYRQSTIPIHFEYFDCSILVMCT